MKGVLVTHGRLGEALVEAAEEISGARGALVAVSNRGVGPEELRHAVSTAIGAGPAVVFVDLASGSCGFAASACARGAHAVGVVTGVNLPMVLDFLFHLELPVDQLLPRLAEKARAGIQVREA